MNAKFGAVLGGAAIGAGILALLLFHEPEAEPVPPFEGAVVDASAPASAEPRAAAPLENNDDMAQGKGAAPPTAMVEVQGAVAHPGLYALVQGARLFDALASAGGATAEADTSGLNIAARLIDGSVVSVPYRAAYPGDGTPDAAALNPPAYTRAGWRAGAPGTMGEGSLAPGAGGLVNLNTATQQELESLPGVGPKTAEKIMRFRSEQPFANVDDLRYIQGIGEKRLETLRPLVTVEEY